MSKKTWVVYNLDDDGREQTALMRVQATSSAEARKRAAKILNNREIVTTGFYSARPFGADHKRKIAMLQRDLNVLTIIRGGVLKGK